MNAWIARSKTGHLRLYSKKPDRTYNRYTCEDCWGDSGHSMALNPLECPNLKWKDEPVEAIIDTKKELIKRFEILHANYYFDSQKFFQENPGKGYMSFDEYASNNWDKVDMNFFDTIG